MLSLFLCLKMHLDFFFEWHGEGKGGTLKDNPAYSLTLYTRRVLGYARSLEEMFYFSLILKKLFINCPQFKLDPPGCTTIQILL